MPRLTIEQEGKPPRTVEITAPETLLGRADDNTIVLDTDEVSRHHARIVVKGAHWVLVDQQSLNGTYVNRQRIVERVLGDGDEVWLGAKCRMVFRCARQERPPEPAPSGPVATPPPDDLGTVRARIDAAARTLSVITRRNDAGGGQSPIEANGVVPDMEHLSYAFRRLNAMYQACRLLAARPDLDHRLSAVLDLAIEITAADRGFVVLQEPDTGELRVSVAREMGQDLRAGAPSMGIAGRAARDGAPVLMEDAACDGEFGARESIVRQHIVSAMAAPLVLEGKPPLGAVYVDTRKAGRSFDTQDLELFAAMASQAAMAIENVQLYHRMLDAERRRTTLGRFLSPSVVEAVMNSGDSQLRLGGRKARVATLFADIRDFTPLAERMAPSDLIEVLNEHFTAMTEVVFDHGGTLDKYNGDEVMALFGAPIAGEDDPWRAVQAAVAMRQRNALLNEARAARGLPLLEIGIGISSGDVVAGFLGSPKRMDFTVVGDRVNTASRLCSLARAGQIITCREVHEAVKGRVEMVPVGPVALKGKERPEEAYQVLALRG